MKALYKKHQRKFHFVFVGGINTFFGLTTFPILYFLLKPYSIHYMVTLVISQAICVTIAFFTNKYFVFRTKGNHLPEFLKFSLFYSAYFIINLLAMPAMVELAGINPAISQVIISIGIIVSSYFWHSKITFNSQKR